MTIIDKYLGKTVLSAIALVTLMLAGLQLFMLFVGQLGDIGKGDYGVFQALFYVLLQIPYQVYLFFPVACLLGALLGLGMLANHSELLVVRAAGMSVLQVVRAVLQVAIFLVVCVCVLGELFIPRMMHFSADQKALYKSGGQALRTTNGLWLRVQNNFIHVNEAKTPELLLGVNQYRFNEEKKLVIARKIERAEYHRDQWQLYGVKESTFKDNRVIASAKNQVVWDTEVLPQMISVSTKAPDEMSLSQIWRHIRIQKKSHLDVAVLEVSFWRRLFQPLITCVMILLAIPFVFGPLRSMTMGQRFMIGVSVGFGFHILNEFAIPIGQLYQVPPLLAVSLPTVLFAFIGLILVKRQKN